MQRCVFYASAHESMFRDDAVHFRNAYRIRFYFVPSKILWNTT